MTHSILTHSILTIPCKLLVTDEQSEQLAAVQSAFIGACNLINDNTPTNLNNKVRIHHIMYHAVREAFGLPANLVCQAIQRVAISRKAAKFKHAEVDSFEGGSVAYDARVFSLNTKTWIVSLSTLQGRVKLPLDISDYERKLLQNQNPTSAQLLRVGDSWKLNIQIKVEDEPQMLISDMLGVDLGRTDIAVTSDGKTFSGKEVTEKRNHYQKVRTTLQKKAAKGTRSSRRRIHAKLKRLSGREARFTTWVNHNVSRTLVDLATKTRRGIALEDLTGIRERTNKLPQSKQNKRLANSWKFYQLRLFLLYKGKLAGVPVVLVNPAYTSQTCHKCFHIGERSGKAFHCTNTKCGWEGDADLNGARNIRVLGLLVNQPGGSRSILRG
ncbi:MAG: transposase [Comamonadaceae bacterium]|nr:transposase [Comamonadaceae bacterium]